MRVLLAIGHVYAPDPGSSYSARNESKRKIKQQALRRATAHNLERHGHSSWLHATAGRQQPNETRALHSSIGVDLTIQVYAPPSASLAGELKAHPCLQVIDAAVDDLMDVPAFAVRRLLEQADRYDLVGYFEDDILIEDPEFFAKIHRLIELTNGQYVFMPHRCERIPGLGDVILSGDPDQAWPELFWATGETLQLDSWLGPRRFYRAANPHSGCFVLSRAQALKVNQYWQERNWLGDFRFSGPLEHAATGVLLPVLKVMKPVPEHYRFLMVRHQDEIWRRVPLPPFAEPLDHQESDE
jgi:hypothetical protein